MEKKAWEPDFSALTKTELHEVDRKVNEVVSKVNLWDWATGLMAVGMLWALWEKLDKPVKKNLAILAAANIRRDHAIGKVSPGGALGQVENIHDIFPFNSEQKNALKFATQHAGEHLKQISDKTRTAVRLALIEAKRQGTHPKDLAAQLRKTFKGLDRDWRRVAVTESHSIAVNGYVLSQPEGAQVVGLSRPNACPFCKSEIHGQIFTITHVPPQNPNDSKWDSFIWPGKSNVGRVRHARAKGGRVRATDEMWKPSIPSHPHCFCTLVSYNPKLQEVGPDGYLRLR